MMPAKPNEVAMYGITISTDECFEMMLRDDIRMNALTNGKDKPVVYQDPNGFYQMFLYRTPEKRNKAYEKIRKYFKTAAVAVQVVYVEKRYLKGVE